MRGFVIHLYTDARLGFVRVLVFGYGKMMIAIGWGFILLNEIRQFIHKISEALYLMLSFVCFNFNFELFRFFGFRHFSHQKSQRKETI